MTNAKSTHRRARRTRWLVAAALFGVVAAGCSDHSDHAGSTTVPASVPAASAAATAPSTTSADASAATVVSMRNVQFFPATLEVKVGTVVEWKNDDLVAHTATGTSFDSGSIASGDSWKHTFTEAGTFPYVCRFHSHMKGTVVVK